MHVNSIKKKKKSLYCTFLSSHSQRGKEVNGNSFQESKILKFIHVVIEYRKLCSLFGTV